jgi:radical SAM protein with 4Fe4S-binding SPASM domain
MAHVNKQMISFFVTTSCNLDCSYCYTNKDVSERRNQRLNLDFAKVGIDDFFARNSSRHIRFFGPGEPTVAFDLVKSIYEYAYGKAGEALSVEIQTNGVFSRRVADWLAENVNIVWVSSDGPPDVQDFYRFTINKKPTSRMLTSSIRYLVENGRGMTGIRSTITEKTISRQKEIVDYFSSLGVKHIWSDPLFPAVGEKSDYRSFDFNLYAENFLEARTYAKKKGIFYGTFLACNFDEETEYHCRACIPLPHLTTDGYVSACDMALFGELRSSEQHMAPFIYGKWDAKTKTIIYYEDKIKNLRRRKAENMPGCKGCPALKHCAGYCLGEVTNESGDMFGKKPVVCDSIVYLYSIMHNDMTKYEYFHP